MNRTETVNLLALAVEAQPTLQINDGTADVWHDVLRLQSFQDCRAGLISALRHERYLTVAGIHEHAQKARAARLERTFSRGGAPDADPDDVRGYLAALRAGRVQDAPTRTAAPALVREAVPAADSWPPPPPRESLREMAARLAAARRETVAREAAAAQKRERAAAPA